jgi:hypothetical protein
MIFSYCFFIAARFYNQFYFKTWKKCKHFKLLLISKTILLTAIRTLPGYPIAGHTPLVFIHTFLAHGKPTPAIPAEPECFTATMAMF